MVLEKLEYDEKCVYQIEHDTWTTWYPLDSLLEDMDAVNEVLTNHSFQLQSFSLKPNGTLPENGLDSETFAFI